MSKPRLFQGDRTSLLGQGRVQEQLNADDYCPVDGCYRKAVSAGSYCPRHKQNIVRYGAPQPRSIRDRVSDAAGPECRICGRSVYEHGVTEFCQEIVRRMIA